MPAERRKVLGIHEVAEGVVWFGAEGTVEITEDGRRFLVESAGGRRIANAYRTGVRIL